MKKEELFRYHSPTVEITEIAVEDGFAATGLGMPGNDDSLDVNDFSIL